jgi:hypothetical protein
MYSKDTKPVHRLKGRAILGPYVGGHSENLQYLVFLAAPISRYTVFTDVIRAYFVREKERDVGDPPLYRLPRQLIYACSGGVFGGWKTPYQVLASP